MVPQGSEALLDWAADVVGTPSFTAREPLPGGSASDVWRLTADTPRGPLTVVAKQLRAGLPAADADLIAREARVLDALRPFDLPVPEALACDPDGVCTGRPAMVMSLVPGTLLQGPDALRAAIPEYVRALVTFQERTRGLLAGRRYRPWFDLESLVDRSDSDHAELWSRAAELVRRFPSPATDGFVHRDPHPANLLFEDGHLTGIIDWPNAGRGPRGIDLSRMAINLACLLDVDATRELRERWESATGQRHDPLLDVYALLECGTFSDPPHPTWVALDAAPDATTGAARLEAFLADTLRRMTVRRMK